MIGASFNRGLLATKTLGSKSIFRCVSAHPVTGKKPPTLEEFDPLNPGDWQIGVGGKILPRLPIGTKCGKLVMGKYGLRNPAYDEYLDAHQKGLDSPDNLYGSEDATPWDRRHRDIAWYLSVAAGIIGMFQFYQLATQELWWPWSAWHEKRKKERGDV
ncbi:KASH (Klarsicht/ANC-1/Syne Homology) Domain Protein [Ditylenchus destructor]|nr:KASH (Klarsicht/ANC-1/Syne Homology) Domain Protein [Ditylenchus destructor]